jgi:anti-sigma factor RsiW
MAVMTEHDDRAEISLLLPWYAAGTLDASTHSRVAAAIEQDPELARRLGDIREEAAEAIFLNESIAAPSRRAADRLFSAIEAEEPPARRVPAPRRRGFSEWLHDTLALARPQTLAFATVAAAAVIALQAVLLVVGSGQRGGGFQTATAPTASTGSAGRILVSFAPEATIAEIEAVLRDAGASIVTGPEAGMYRLGFAGDQKMQDRVLQILRERPGIVRFAGPAS